MACLSGDTTITLANGEKTRIDNIQVGDLVRTTKGIEKVIYSDAKLHKVADKYVKYVFDNGKEIKVIKDHRIYSLSRKAFVHFSSLKIGEPVLCEDGKIARLKTKQAFIEKINHYTLYTEDSNAYYANGFVSGNIFSNFKPAWLRRWGVKTYIALVQGRKEK
jgi:hypothetical protein